MVLVKDGVIDNMNSNMIITAVIDRPDRSNKEIGYTYIYKGKDGKARTYIFDGTDYIQASKKSYACAFLNSTPQSQVILPSNNDGRDVCAFCSSPTKKWQGLNIFIDHRVCTKCGR